MSSSRSPVRHSPAVNDTHLSTEYFETLATQPLKVVSQERQLSIGLVQIRFGLGERGHGV